MKTWDLNVAIEVRTIPEQSHSAAVTGPESKC
jgi:hypothetical protein